ncbi:hypothetical protein PGT21_003319 [Puccinia graminis f. sp. tritici]|uniref:Uncharacterized protein n=1 Tax=Puccinia graminis f. sp. tritici TaxID=56615 RepID=A0A5B0QHG9_PUCGR|nr:hypothetical protein PGT21_003135 [Puccinia graminis f. sp. tritici]KAA1112603.1 hypothetical protein PGT21_003319 [Puccinia graminis f. sp. tritici]
MIARVDAKKLFVFELFHIVNLEACTELQLWCTVNRHNEMCVIEDVLVVGGMSSKLNCINTGKDGMKQSAGNWGDYQCHNDQKPLPGSPEHATDRTKVYQYQPKKCRVQGCPVIQKSLLGI